MGDKEIKEKTYSWSRINSFHQGLIGEGCLYGWNLAYIKGDRGMGNYFSEVGLLTHNLIELYNTGEIFDWDLEEMFENGYNDLEFKAPFPAMGKSYYNSLKNFFTDGDLQENFNDYEILESEEELIFTIKGHKFKGFADMVARKDGGIVIVDFKTSKPYEGSKLKHNIMQLYIYAIAVKEKYGEYPTHLAYIYPKEMIGFREYIYEFNLDDLGRAVKFVEETIEMMEKHDFEPRCSKIDGKKDFYANHLCNHRKGCPYKTL